VSIGKKCTNHPLRHGGCIVHDFLVQIQIVQLLEALLLHLSNDFMIFLHLCLGLGVTADETCLF
jgi:hypothetical protein